MRLLKSPKEIDQTISQLMTRYQCFEWMCAWASVDFDSYKMFIKYQNRCSKVIVGTHFFQTHPDFVEAMSGNKGVRFMKQTDELFHPKSYLFYNNRDDWQLLVGSANFTKGAFSANTELLLWIDSADCPNHQVLNDYRSMVDGCWKEASAFDLDEAEKYRSAWENAKSKRDSLSRNYGISSSKMKKGLDMEIQTMTWNDYVEELMRRNTDIEMRTEMLRHINTQFAMFRSFRDMPDELRKFIAGVQNKYESGITGDYEPWKAFGDMSGFGIYANKIIHNERGIGKALDSIPLTGQVTKDDYLLFARYFIKVFSKTSLATATRLLAMKRPDVFYCLTKYNKREFCSKLGVPYSRINLDSYWDLVVLPIQDSEWWLHSKPKDDLERAIKNGRAAFLDSIYYEEK